MFKLASAKITRMTLVPLLAVWVAGAGCLFGCEIMAAGHDSGPGSVQKLSTIVSGEVCASSKSHDCCAKSRNKASAHDGPSESGAPVVLPNGSSGSMLRCPLAVNTTAIITKVGFKDATATVETFYVTPPQKPVELSTSRSTPLHLPDREHTYLRCCSFLI